MSTYYTIISANLRPEIQERLSIGLFISNGEHFHFQYSKNKLAAARTLLSADAFQTLKDGLLNIERLCNEEKKSSSELFQTKAILHQTSYIDYLSRYNNNLIVFSKPKVIDVEFNAENFNHLYSQYIENLTLSPNENLTLENKIELFKQTKGEVLAKYFDIDKEITSKEVLDLIVPVSVTLIGKNENPTFVQSIDMNKRVDYIRNDIAEVLFLQKAFKTADQTCVAMALTEEPDKQQYPVQHTIWQQLRKVNDIRNVDISEAETIIDYAIEHGVQPLFAKKEGS